MDLGFSYLSKKEKGNILKGISECRVPMGPLHVEIHPTDGCNIRCFFCSTRWRRKNDEMPMEVISSIMDQLKELGTKSILLSGGGDPLAHHKKEKILDVIKNSGIRLFGVTTNGVGLNKAVRERLIHMGCEQIIVSLNCSDERSYAEMMEVSPKVFHLVVNNIKLLIEERKKRTFPKLIIQFLAYKKNYKTIPDMYNLAKKLKVDGILFNGLSFLPDELKMDQEETKEMLNLYYEILKVDEYRKILSINSYEQDIGDELSSIEKQIGEARSSRRIFRKFHDFFDFKEYSLKDKLKHRRKMRVKIKALDFLMRGMDPCIRPWHAMTIRPDGNIPICCVRQHVIMGNIHENSIKEVWEGENFSKFRQAMRKVIYEGKNYRLKNDNNYIFKSCLLSSIGFDACPFRSYYQDDINFMRQLAKMCGTHDAFPKLLGH